MANLEFISEGNAKTDCFSFDLPAKLACPGMTESCAWKCYAAQLMLLYPAVARKYLRNLEFANSDKFIPHMIRDIPRNCEFRIHVSGDYKDSAYVLDWYAIASKRPDVTFYTYTRSWRIPKIWTAIQHLAELPNVTVNLSCDKDTGKPDCPNASSYRWAYLTHARENEDAPKWLRKGDIVFRSLSAGHKRRRKNAVKKNLDPDVVAPLVHRIGKAPVCPFERGKNLDNFSCSRCRLCIAKPREAVHA